MGIHWVNFKTFVKSDDSLLESICFEDFGSLVLGLIGTFTVSDVYLALLEIGVKGHCLRQVLLSSNFVTCINEYSSTPHQEFGVIKYLRDTMLLQISRKLGGLLKLVISHQALDFETYMINTHFAFLHDGGQICDCSTILFLFNCLINQRLYNFQVINGLSVPFVFSITRFKFYWFLKVNTSCFKITQSNMASTQPVVCLRELWIDIKSPFAVICGQLETINQEICKSTICIIRGFIGTSFNCLGVETNGLIVLSFFHGIVTFIFESFMHGHLSYWDIWWVYLWLWSWWSCVSIAALAGCWIYLFNLYISIICLELF